MTSNDEKHAKIQVLEWFTAIEDEWIAQREQGLISRRMLKRMLKASERSRLATVVADNPRLRSSPFTKRLLRDVPEVSLDE